MNRRAFLSGLIAAPAVIRVAPLMRIVPVPLRLTWRTPLPEMTWRPHLIHKLLNPPVWFGPDDGLAKIMKPHEIAPGMFTELPSPPS